MASPLDIWRVSEPRFLNILGRSRDTQIVAIPPSDNFPDGLRRPTEPQPALNSWVPQTPGAGAHLNEVEMDVYTGVLSLRYPYGDELKSTEFSTFLPVGPMVLKDYGHEGGANLVDFTATATPSSVEPVEDAATLFAVDGVPDVQIVKQSQLAGDPRCLVMTVAVAGLNVTIHRIAYQVTVLVGQRGVGPSFLARSGGLPPIHTRRCEHPSSGAPGPIATGLPRARTLSGNCPPSSGHVSATA